MRVGRPVARGRPLVLRRGGLSVRVSPAAVLLGTGVWAVACCVAVLSLTIGEYSTPLADVLAALGGRGTLITYDVVVRNRLPRALVALLVGAALALSGSVFQRIARNPLVSPDVIGINAGAAAGAVVVITVFAGGATAVACGALVGAGGAAALVHVIARRSGFHAYRLVLVGIGVTALLGSTATFLLTRSDRNAAMQGAIWLVGSLAGRTGAHVAVAATGLLVLAPVVLVLTRLLRLLELGDDLARSLAGRVDRGRAALLAAAVGLAALATAAAGPLAFVALVAPQIVRRLLGGGHAGPVPTAGVGALILIGADVAARLLFAPHEVPTGVVTALLGAPVLIALLIRSR